MELFIKSVLIIVAIGAVIIGLSALHVLVSTNVQTLVGSLI